jgi:hypothetical protein
MPNIGPGDTTINDWAVSGGSSFWTNLGTTVRASGGIFRPTSMGVHYRADSGSNSARNVLWDAAGPRRAFTPNYTLNTTSEMKNASITTVFWCSDFNYFGGFWRTASANSRTEFRDGTFGSYGGLSADDGTVAGYTANWGGVGNPGGIPWTASIINSLVWVRRSSAWVRLPVFVRRSGGWTQIQVGVRRSGTWTAVNWIDWMAQTEQHLPEMGMEVEVSVEDGPWERGWITEAEKGWFGSVDPTRPTIYTGRNSSREPEEVAEQRLELYDAWGRAITQENTKKATKIANVLWPSAVPGQVLAPWQQLLLPPSYKDLL